MEKTCGNCKYAIREKEFDWIDDDTKKSHEAYSCRKNSPRPKLSLLDPKIARSSHRLYIVYWPMVESHSFACGDFDERDAGSPWLGI